MTNSKMKLLFIAGGIFAVCFGIFIAASRFYEGITERQTQIDNLQLEDTNLTARLARLQKQKKEVDNWRAVTLSSNVNASAMMYKGFLQEMMLKHKFTLKSFSDPAKNSAGARGAIPPTSHVSYDVVFESTFAQLSSFLQEFYSLNVPHVIKNIAVEPLGRGGDTKLSVTMKVDVLAMSNSPEKNSVLANPTMSIALLESVMAMKRLPGGLLFGLSQLSNTGLFGNSKLASKSVPDREYATMLQKNVFAGLMPKSAVNVSTGGSKPADKDILKFTQLTSITANNITEEALLRVRKTNKYVKLRAEGGVNEFEIRDADNLLVLKGKVLAIKPRDLVFEREGKAYLLHIGEFIEEALKKELTPDELKQHDVALSVNEQN